MELLFESEAMGLLALMVLHESRRAALHAEAPCADQTNWEQIVGLYDVLARADPSPSRMRCEPTSAAGWE